MLAKPACLGKQKIRSNKLKNFYMKLKYERMMSYYIRSLSRQKATLFFQHIHLPPVLAHWEDSQSIEDVPSLYFCSCRCHVERY